MFERDETLNNFVKNVDLVLKEGGHFFGTCLDGYLVSEKLKNKDNNIIAYGAPAKATTALNFFGISNEIECIVEDNKLKQGKLLPGVKIPIVSKSEIKNKPDFALVLAWNFINEIKNKNVDLAHKFISIKDLEN